MQNKRGSRKAKHELVHDKSTCVVCRNEQEFEIPDHLMKQVTSRNAVIFAGAGVSTETPTVFPWTFYDEIHAALGMSQEDKPGFPKLMSLYCKRPDGRRELLKSCGLVSLTYVAFQNSIELRLGFTANSRHCFMWIRILQPTGTTISSESVELLRLLMRMTSPFGIHVAGRFSSSTDR